MATDVDQIRDLMAAWWQDEKCCDSDWCALGKVDTRLGQVLAELGLVRQSNVR